MATYDIITYLIINEKYNINFDLKYDTFYYFIDSLRKI